MHKKTLNCITALLFVGVVFFAPIEGGAAIFEKGERMVTALSQNNPYGWEKLSAYTTYYDEKDGGRVENIRIASALIDGITVQAFGEFSFNQTVGKRTKEAGFQQAKIIVNGAYAQGVGGGVCQVSTTLYNAVLKSGLTVVEFHPHTLSVSYVAPSRDAMVSDGSDLRFFNPYAHPVYLSSRVFKGGIQIGFYGQSDGLRYEIVSEKTETLPPPPAVIKYGEREEIMRAEKEGVKSKAYLETYRGGALIGRKKIREDEYRPVQGIIVKKMPESTNYG